MRNFRARSIGHAIDNISFFTLSTLFRFLELTLALRNYRFRLVESPAVETLFCRSFVSGGAGACTIGIQAEFLAIRLLVGVGLRLLRGRGQTSPLVSFAVFLFGILCAASIVLEDTHP